MLLLQVVSAPSERVAELEHENALLKAQVEDRQLSLRDSLHEEYLQLQVIHHVYLHISRRCVYVCNHNAHIPTFKGAS